MFKLAKEHKLDQEVYGVISSRDKLLYLVDGNFNETSKSPRVQIIFASDNLSSHPGDFWSDISTTGLEFEGDVSFKNGKKPLRLLKRILKMNLKGDGYFLDYFAGSGSSAHAVIDLNREDDGKRRYILVEQGEHFNTTLKPRIHKVVYSAEWKSGSPLLPKSIEDEANRYDGVSHCLKVIKLESYEDTLNNLELIRTQEQEDLFGGLMPEQKDDYLMHYMLDIESQGSLLNVNSFRNPFDYQLKVAADSAGAYTEQTVDLIDTFNYLIGLKVKFVDYQLNKGYVQVVGNLHTGELVTVLWRDTEQVDYDRLDKILAKLAINPNDKEYSYIYINGDHNINAHLVSTEGAEKQLKVRSIEQVFFEQMFSE